MEFCAGNINPKYHHYKDVNPKEVQELYSGCEYRKFHRCSSNPPSAFLFAVSTSGIVQISTVKERRWPAALLSNPLTTYIDLP